MIKHLIKTNDMMLCTGVIQFIESEIIFLKLLKHKYR